MRVSICTARSLPCGLSTLNTHAERRGWKHLVSHLRSYSTKEQSSLSYCVDLVKKYDYENYLGNLLLPKECQRAAFALRSFNVELAQVRDTVSERQIGLMRMQFWKDAIEKIYRGQAPNTPVATELAGTCEYYNLSKHWLERIIEARAAQLGQNSYPTVKSVEDYAEKVNSSLYYLLLECLGIKDVQADHAASHLGKAQGLVTVLRATPYHASVRQVYLPMETLAKHKVSQEDIVRGQLSQGVKEVIFDIASLGHQHLEKARSLQKSIPSKAYLVFLNASVCDHYLKSLQKVDFNIFDGKLQQKNALLAYQMYMNKLRRKF